MRTKKELLTGEWAVLALLCEHPAHGYALATAMAPDGEIGRIWSLGQPLVYRALEVLRSAELIEVAAITPGDRAPRRIQFTATARAKRMVTRWLTTPEPHVRDLRSNLLLKLTFLQRRGRSPLRLLEGQRDLLADRTAALANVDGRGGLVEQWRWTMADAALRFVDEAIRRERAS